MALQKHSIKDLISEEINKDATFIIGDNIGADIRENFPILFNEFYNSKTYGEANRNAKKLFDFFLKFHEKNTIVGPCFQVLNDTETFGDIYKKQRLHSIHSINVFLLGLLLYFKNPIIKKYINEEIESTSIERKLEIGQEIITWKYSGDSIFSEFLYRWRLCALPHDIGYSISLLKNNKSKIDRSLLNQSISQDNKINSIDSLVSDSNQNLLDLIDKSMSFFQLQSFFDYQKSNPISDCIFLDHGIISALLVFNLLKKEVKKNTLNQTVYNRSSGIVWHDSFIDISILRSVRAIACHNLNQNSEMYKKFKTVDNIYKLENEPLIWLLKVSDELQEWDKPESKPNYNKQVIPKTDINVEFNDEQIIFYNFPIESKAKLVSFLKEIGSDNLIKIK